MMLRRSRSRSERGVATAELALLLPFLMAVFVGVTDFARVFYYAMTITNCARNGALWACDPINATQSPYTNVTDAALADASNLSPTPTVTSTTGTDFDGQPYVSVTVTYTFQSITAFPLFPSSLTLTRTVQMRQIPLEPSFN
jgi:Flp pilus assembly protein TadG